MKRLRHQVLARRDLAEIWAYTSLRWSASQADLYLLKIDDRAQQLADGKVTGAAHHGRYLSVRVGSHLIFYRETAREVTIVRVLHTRMDARRHLR